MSDNQMRLHVETPLDAVIHGLSDLPHDALLNALVKVDELAADMNFTQRLVASLGMALVREVEANSPEVSGELRETLRLFMAGVSAGVSDEASENDEIPVHAYVGKNDKGRMDQKDLLEAECSHEARAGALLFAIEHGLGRVELLDEDENVVGAVER